MKSKAALVARILLGLVFFVFGLNGFLGFLEEPEGTPEGEAFITALIDTGYLMMLLKVIETTCGALLLAGYFVPLALVLLAPIIVNILGFHLFLDLSGQGLGMAIVILVLHLFLTTQHWSAYAPLLVAKVGASEAAAGGDVEE